ncbi:protease m1 Zinc metalloprotease [Plakobranchus ocellatus]|uniref:Aminopeptidase n=1 Tax=Plakobranchus ocellatus TaxID=259542 RepID=A0AAV4A6G7_9GAST|nr:protease m1 Zinc metalloprotease [Plakobranchus ocellatus]
MSGERTSKRLIIILAVVFLAATVITGVIVWKVTKDAYDDGDNDGQSDAKNVRVSQGAGGDGGGGGGGAGKGGNGDSVKQPTQVVYTEEELREKPWLALRMSRDILPVHYDITMYPDFYDEASQFYGNETIELEVRRATHFILIHIHTTYLNVTSTRVQDTESGADIEVARVFNYEPNEFFVVETAQEIPAPGNVTLTLGFEGSLVKGIVGIYKSTYLNTKTNETRHITTSKFEPTYARRAFPCFDEPNIKAEYTITLIHKPSYIALSNMPQNRKTIPSSVIPGLVSTKFQRSVKMSTYLVCYIVCDFEYRETFSKTGKPIRVYATPDKIDQVEYSLDLAKHTLDLYEDMFNMSYPLPKQDLIAIPDFVSGAMEHWGLITFRESRLLIDKVKSSLSNIESVSVVVAHEMSHMWFGNIVTMDWWNDLWLNEGFASYMEYLGVDGKNQDWHILDRFLTRDLFPVMVQDSELSSHPIIVDVERPSQITSVFDSISYSKGSSVIRMLEAILGKENFFNGVSNYLKRFQWQNAKTDDLWQCLSEAMANGNKQYDVKHIMDTWTIQDGFPVVSITTMTSDLGKTTVKAKQSRFLSNPSVTVDPSSSPLGYKWYIALDYQSSMGDSGSQVMDMNDITFEADLGLKATGSWVKFNAGQMGFYRVLYPDTMWKAFSDHLLQTDQSNWKLSSPDRAGLLSDSFSLAAAGLVSYEVPLQLMSYLARERQYVPWRAARSGFLYIDTMLRRDPDYGLWRVSGVHNYHFDDDDDDDDDNGDSGGGYDYNDNDETTTTTTMVSIMKMIIMLDNDNDYVDVEEVDSRRWLFAFFDDHGDKDNDDDEDGDDYVDDESFEDDINDSSNKNIAINISQISC